MAEERETALRRVADADQEVSDAASAIADAEQRAALAGDAREQAAAQLRAAQDRVLVLTGKLDSEQQAREWAQSLVATLTAQVTAATDRAARAEATLAAKLPQMEQPLVPEQGIASDLTGASDQSN